MICPFCGHENIDGIDVCANCGRELANIDEPQAASGVESRMIRGTLAALRPKPPVIVSPETTVADTVAKLCGHNIGCVLVGTMNQVVGIFSERDVLLRIADRYPEVASRPVSEFMTPDPEMLDVNTPIAFALNRMSLGDFRHIPVTDAGRLVGVVSIRDLLGLLSRWYPDLVRPILRR